MTFIKHLEHGNKHVSAEQAAALVRDGWVIWPRSKDAKAGIAPIIDAKESEVIKRKPGRPPRKEA